MSWRRAPLIAIKAKARLDLLARVISAAPSLVFIAVIVSCLRNSLLFVAFKMGCRQGAAKGASPYGAVTEPQRRRQRIFNATLRAGTLFRSSGVASLGRDRRGYRRCACALQNRQIGSS